MLIKDERYTLWKAPIIAGKLRLYDNEKQKSYLPNKMECFKNRDKDLYEVLTGLINKNIIQILGCSGYGKSSLLKTATYNLG